MHRLRIVLAGALLLVACKSKENGAAPRGSSEAPRATASASATSAPPAAAPASAPASSELAEAAVSAVLEAWLAAQNALDFDAYAGLYASKFSGIKRVGERTERFAREGWLKDRRPMFRPGLRVQAEDVKIVRSGAMARIVFAQAFSTPTFRDRGTKSLTILPTTEGPRIVFEEMLDSELGEASGGAQGSDLFFVGDGAVYLRRPVPPAALLGPPRLVPAGAAPVRAVEVALDPARLAPVDKAWLDARLETVSPSGKRCTSAVSSLVARFEAVMHFGQEQHWRGEDGEGPASAASIAQEVFGMARPGEVELVARLSEACPGALLARKGMAPPELHAPSAPSAPVAELLRAHFAASEQSKARQSSFRAYSGEDKRWFAASEPTVRVVSDGGRIHTAVVSAPLYQECGFHGLNLLVEFDTAQSPPRIVSSIELAADDKLVLLGALDEDGDGRLELVTGPTGYVERIGLWRSVPGGYRQLPLFDVAYWDCPC